MAIKLVVPVIIACALATYLILPPRIPHSPSSTTITPNAVDQNHNYLVLGFAPYWNLKKITPLALSSITHYAYFNLHLNGDGTIYTKLNRREEDPGYTNYKRLIGGTVETGGKPLIITFMPESQAALAQMVSSELNRQRTIQTILQVIEQSQAQGINIDFEPLGDTPATLRNNFTSFIADLSSSLDERTLLTISIYASAATKPRIWDLQSLANHVSYFVVMSYDYTMPGSDVVGPNAPLRGSGTLFEHDVIENIAEITRLVDRKKILLGIPFYGYEWDTKDGTKYTVAESRGSVASLERIDQMIKDKTLELVWDRNTLTPYGIASDSGQISQIYFENETSIKLKLDLVKSSGLGGIAIWALGYEGDSDRIWNVIRSELRPRP